MTLYTDGAGFYHECVLGETIGYCALYIIDKGIIKCYHKNCKFILPSILILDNWSLKYSPIVLGPHPYIYVLSDKYKKIDIIL